MTTKKLFLNKAANMSLAFNIRNTVCNIALVLINIVVIFYYTGGNMTNMSSGQKFMISLLINSLTSDGGLEQSLKKALETETIAAEEIRVWY